MLNSLRYELEYKDQTGLHHKQRALRSDIKLADIDPLDCLPFDIVLPLVDAVELELYRSCKDA